MPTRRATAPIGRRGILGLAGLGIAAAAAGVTVRAHDVEKTEAAEHADKPRYRVTADVENFYRVNRYPAK
jgi:hypothetical protein